MQGQSIRKLPALPATYETTAIQLWMVTLPTRGRKLVHTVWRLSAVRRLAIQLWMVTLPTRGRKFFHTVWRLSAVRRPMKQGRRYIQRCFIIMTVGAFDDRWLCSIVFCCIRWPKHVSINGTVANVCGGKLYVTCFTMARLPTTDL